VIRNFVPVPSYCFSPESGLERQVKEILHKAFWEILRTELESDPPQFKQVCTLGALLQNRLMTAVPQLWILTDLSQTEPTCFGISGFYIFYKIDKEIKPFFIRFDRDF
jgi:hypothetical protein